jgi:hypothetical protein
MRCAVDSERIAQQAPWRMLTIGSTVWAPFGAHGWRPGTIIDLGKNRGDKTIVYLSFETGGKGRRIAGELYWRKPELKGRDKPRFGSEAPIAATVSATTETAT